MMTRHTPSPHRRTPARLLTCAIGALALLFSATCAHAQTVYRIVGADGRVTFSDKPPVSVDQGKLVGTGTGARSDASGASLPFELRQVASKYPVTLYTTANCGPCDTGRGLLTGRGIPFTERTVTSPEDSEALKRLSGEGTLPFLTIGGQKIKGLSDTEWTQYLDAAGYPKTSLLPSAYKNPAATPLVSAQKAATPTPPKAEEKPPVPAATNPTPAANPANPAGIQF